MTVKQAVIKKKSVVKLALSGLSLSVLLTLSACSGGDNAPTDEPAVVNETEAVVVEPAAPAEAEPVVEVETVEVSEVKAEEVSAAAAEPEVLAADAGAALYEKQCKVCHEKGLLAAPVFGNKEAWAPRIAKGIDTLHMHSAKGFNKMPAQASAEVSEAQVHAAVDYMVAAAS
ncbi:c-type cytochrome [Psychrobacter cryohalolentis]|uniref:Cytochrome c, class I n=1 Tax=Psychrobacter cryohalolentis (strain ATCC BAA-1226 / DSM 17306 / VKM B-2378 / K5) TaxID=335284 RepID=Q1QE86_PSYCK|nr:c-type cytochrome [Psychrobacter cryohalolentis]ABE74017.1 cytochrome c, class I [Psychrobacter cryohalolentis K5]ASE26654.1 cytochrome c5 family protein [Psychrobacter cryohalolentis]